MLIEGRATLNERSVPTLPAMNCGYELTAISYSYKLRAMSSSYELLAISLKAPALLWLVQLQLNDVH